MCSYCVVSLHVSTSFTFILCVLHIFFLKYRVPSYMYCTVLSVVDLAFSISFNIHQMLFHSFSRPPSNICSILSIVPPPEHLLRPFLLLCMIIVVARFSGNK